THIVRCDIEDLVKLSQCFRETTQDVIGKRVLGKESDVARVEPLGFAEVGLASLPLASPPFEVRQGFRNPTAVGQKGTRLLKVTHRGVVILQARVMVIALSPYGLAEIRLKSERGFRCLPRLFTERERWLKTQCD